ncbi:MAG: ABC transporter permease [Treponema sp.]|nr:ABC transporter permease [Treponema sp.]
MTDLLPVLYGSLVIMTPLLLAATGGLFAELSGRLNIALEGQLLIGAFFAVFAVQYTGSLFAGLAASILASTAFSALLAFVSLKLRSNVFIAGLAVNLLANGLSVVLSHRFFNTRGLVALRDFRALPTVELPLVNKIPGIGEFLSGHTPYVYAAWLLLLLSWVAIFKTPFGYRLRACGKHAEELAALGLKPDTYRLIAFLVSGFFCGIAGSLISLRIGGFVPNMTGGRGWIALVVIYLGLRRPLGLLLAAFLFGLAEAVANYVQGFNIPASLVLALPYMVTFLSMVLVSIMTKKRNSIV